MDYAQNDALKSLLQNIQTPQIDRLGGGYTGSASSVNGVLILIFGILGIAVAPIIFGPIAWIMGNSGLAKLNTGSDQSQRGMVNAGRICGIIGTAFGVLSLLLITIVAMSSPHMHR